MNGRRIHRHESPPYLRAAEPAPRPSLTDRGWNVVFAIVCMALGVGFVVCLWLAEAQPK